MMNSSDITINSLQTGDFNELRSVAQKIDSGLGFLEKKLSNIGSLGLTTHPEKTKIIAENLIKEYEDEIQEILGSLDECIEMEQRILDETIENNQRVSDFLHKITGELTEVETMLLSKGNYQLYESSEKKENCCSQISFNESTDTTDNSICPNSTKLLSTNMLNISNVQIMSPLIMSSTKAITHPVQNDKYEVEIDKSMNELSINNSKFLSQTKFNFNDEIIRTPIDPGISTVSRQLLRKSDFNSKIYINNSYHDKSNK